MTNRIFAENAPSNWNAGLVAIPSIPDTKRPAFKNWTSYQTNMPSSERKEGWLKKYGDHGIGVLTGIEIAPGFQLVAIDIDDDNLVRATRGFIGDIPSAKRGKKGETICGLAPKPDNIKSTVLRGKNGVGNIDILIGGKFTVIPPTIHMDTGEPYVWIGKDLAKCDLSTLPIIDTRKLAVLKQAISSEHTAAIISGVGTHDPGVAFVAELVARGATDDELTALMTGLLPEDYSSDSLDELPEWIRSAREKRFDEPQKKKAAREKQSVVANRLAHNLGIEQLRTELGEAWVSVPVIGGGRICHPVKSSGFSSWVRYQYFKTTGKPLDAGALTEVVDLMEAQALYESPIEEVHVRYAKFKDDACLDLGREDCKVVRITKSGWELIDQSPVRFWQPPGFGEIPIPVKDGDLSVLQDLLALDDLNYILVVAFILNCFNPDGPYMALLVQGKQGSGKSVLSSFIKRIVDPNITDKVKLPNDEHSLAILVSQQWLTSFDNTSGFRADISDFCCSVLTDGAFSTRKYYTDNESRIFKIMRPLMMNGIGEFASRPDFLERSIQIDLPTMPKHGRRTEKQLNSAFDEILPGLLGAILDCVVSGLKNLEHVDPPTSLRMADAARWIVAAEPATDFTPGSMLQALVGMQHEMMTDRVVNDPLVVALLKILEEGPFEGTVGALHQRIQMADQYNKRLPATAAHLSKTFQRLIPMMQEIGLMVELGEKTRKGKMVKVWLKGELAGIDVDHGF